MNTPEHVVGTLTIEDDEEVIHTYRVSIAEYNLYEKDGQKWLTLYCRTYLKISPQDDLHTEPWMEINVPLQEPISEMKSGDKIIGSAYDDAFGGWLTNFYYFTHSGLEEPEIIIFEASPQSIRAEIRGEGDYLPVVISARFIHNPERFKT
jgi:hypothetical protein